MKIVDDETIVADFALPCGVYNVIVMGKQNYVLKRRLSATPPVSVEEVSAEAELSIYPNPSSGIFTVEVGENFLQGEISVMDMYGKEILRNEKIERSTEVDLSAYSSGMYFIKLIKDGASKTRK